MGPSSFPNHGNHHRALASPSMDPSPLDVDHDSDLFFDALDAFPSSHHDPEPLANGQEDEIPAVAASSSSSQPPPPPSSLRRRRLSAPRSPSDRHRPSKLVVTFKDPSAATDRPPDSSISTITSDQISTGIDTSAENQIPVEDGSPTQGLLISIAGFVVKAVFFQFTLLINCLKFPIWVMYSSFLFITDPFGTMKLARNGVKEGVLWIFKFLMEKFSLVLVQIVGGQQGVGKLAVRLAFGCFWVSYICVVLFGLLATAFVSGRMVIAKLVEEPIRIKEQLSFDYTKASPDAFVPLVPCGGGSCTLECNGSAGVGKHGGWRPVPPNHKLQLTVSLILPESDYNRNLGVFQVRTEFLSASGKVTSSSKQPCMLRFKSPHIQLFETFLKSGTLLAGYSSESQTLRLKMKGFIEGIEPTVCVRVILEQRAEYKPGAGIPELYAASLNLESELPLLKRMMWNWKRTMFIWISTGLFFMQLLFVLICCRPLILPRVGSGGRPSSRPS